MIFIAFHRFFTIMGTFTIFTVTTLLSKKLMRKNCKPFIQFKKKKAKKAWRR